METAASDPPCSGCSWTKESQDHCSYQSNVKLFYGAGDRGAWSLGTKFILKDRGTNPPIYEGINTRFIKEKTTIPIPAVAQEWTENNRHFIITERVPGLTLEEHWPKMSQADREELAEETAEYLAQLRQLHSPKMESVPVNRYTVLFYSQETTTLSHRLVRECCENGYRLLLTSSGNDPKVQAIFGKQLNTSECR